MLEGDAAATDAVLAGQKGAAAGDRGPQGGGRHATPGGDHSWALVRANKARNPWCQWPRKPGCHQVAGRTGTRAITSFPHSTEPSPDPERTTKDSLRFPTVSAEPLLPPQNPNLVLGENSALLPNVLQPSRAEPFPQLVHQDLAHLRIPPSRGLSAPCWPESEDEPRVLHTHSPAKQHRAVAVPGGAGRVRSAGGEARDAEPRGLPGTGRRRATGWVHHCSPRAGQRSGGRHQTK